MKALEFSFSKGRYSFLAVLSGWMANLGVLPWLRPRAFRLAPILRLRLALLVLVIRVRETIFQLLECFIPSSAGPVKGILLLLLGFQPFGARCWAAHENDHVISIGEHLEIASRGLHRFSVTDQQVIAYKWLEQQGRFLVEGKKLGYSELVIWDAKKRKATHRFYVLSKRSFLKLKRIQKTLTTMGLQASLQGHILVARGIVKERRHYFILHKILQQNREALHLDVTLQRGLRNDLIARAYKILLDQAPSGVSCNDERIHITCFYQREDAVGQDIKRKLKRDYAISLVAKLAGKGRQNYRIRLLIFQLERTDGKEINLGLNQLQTTGEELFAQGIQALVAKNQVLLRQNHIEVSTLAWPETMAMAYQESTIEMGAEIPYPVQGKQADHLAWKFAGIRLKMTLFPQGDQIKVRYLTEVKRPGEQGHVQGSLNQSVAGLRLGEVREIFQVGLQTLREGRTAIPFLQQFPVLGRLFSSSRKGRNFKKIVGHLKVEKMP